MSDKGKKDIWDKLEVLAKVLIPVVVGISVYVWNHERTHANASAAMVEIAVGVLTAVPKGDDDNDPLRGWAVSVLLEPGDPPPLTGPAAKTLRTTQLPSLRYAKVNKKGPAGEFKGMDASDWKRELLRRLRMEEVEAE